MELGRWHSGMRLAVHIFGPVRAHNLSVVARRQVDPGSSLAGQPSQNEELLVLREAVRSE